MTAIKPYYLCKAWVNMFMLLRNTAGISLWGLSK